MVEKSKEVLVRNRYNGVVGYTIPDMQNLRRQFQPFEQKLVTAEEIEKLSFIPGGKRIINEYLVVEDKDTLEDIVGSVEQEYFYTEEDIKRMLTVATLDEFLDCLDFAPEGVIEQIKDLAVTLPCNDVAKRDAILKKTGFDVTNAIEVQNTPFDGDTEAEVATAEAPKRRVQTTEAAKPARRVVKRG